MNILLPLVLLIPTARSHGAPTRPPAEAACFLHGDRSLKGRGARQAFLRRLPRGDGGAS